MLTGLSAMLSQLQAAGLCCLHCSDQTEPVSTAVQHLTQHAPGWCSSGPVGGPEFPAAGRQAVLHQTSSTCLQAAGLSCTQCSRLLADKIVAETTTTSSNDTPQKPCYLVKVQRWMGGTQGSEPGLAQLHCPK